MMKKFLVKSILHGMVKVAGRRRIKDVIKKIANYADINLLLLAYNNIGIHKHENVFANGEHYLITNVLRSLFDSIDNPVFFDVGAYVGNYSLMLSKEFSKAVIYAFEPNQRSFDQLVQNVGNIVKCYNVGLGSTAHSEKLTTYSDNIASEHASIYGKMFPAFHRTNNIVEIDCKMTTIDDFCGEARISDIDFIKIDTEGNELNVLKGGKRMLDGGHIRVIQFEFGECNVFSRVFLQDFYDILADFNLYRLDSERLIPTIEYNIANEIFRYQNFIAVRKDIVFLSE